MKSMIRTVVALATMAGPLPVYASVFNFGFSGPGVSGALSVNYAPNANTGVLPGQSPNPVDPVGSYVITGVSGTFSDVALGITKAAVTGIKSLARVDPEATNLLAPHSFSLLPVANGVQGDGPLSPGLHFDNLFYPGGSPQAASDYPFSGGVFDIYGMIFQIANGDYVNLWSNGVQPRIGLNYGVAVTDGVDALDYTSGVSISAVPELATWAMMLVGFGLIGFAMRRREHDSATGRLATLAIGPPGCAA